jgi:hypothetical protein
VSYGEAEFQACQVTGSLPVQRGAGPECSEPDEVESGGHVYVVEAGSGQAAVAGAASALAGGLVHGAFDADAAGVVGLERVQSGRAGQGPQSPGEKVAMATACPRRVHGFQVAEILSWGQVTVWVS